jgi:hypothetical protein
LGNWTALGLALLVTVGCGPREESLGCAELVVSCPSGDAEQQWWLAKDPTSSRLLEPQGGECGTWLAYIRNDAWAQYDDVDLGTREGEVRLRVVVAADDTKTVGGTLRLFAGSDLTTEVTSCAIKPTGGWFSWLVVDCGPMALTGLHTLTFKFEGTDQYVFNFAAFGVARAGAPGCTVTGPQAD